ncbi:MAG: hypothetical protein GXO72_03095 [Caldiserica bacterium]|nr:hypothetical protein [Caldisericota bacterium]
MNATKKALLAALLLAGGALAPAQPPAEIGPAEGIADQAISLARELRLAMYYAALAVYAPTPTDQRLYIQQVVNLIEGEGGEHTVAAPPARPPLPGMLARLELIRKAMPPDVPPGKRRVLSLILTNIRSFLGFALDESLAALRRGDIAAGAEHMRKAFAFLYAAWGIEVETPYLGGIWLLLRHLGYQQRPMSPEDPRP